MKTVEEIPRNERPAIYAVLYPKLRTIALENGYALAIHGSVVSDVEVLIVVGCRTPGEYVSQIRGSAGLIAVVPGNVLVEPVSEEIHTDHLEIIDRHPQ